MLCVGRVAREVHLCHERLDPAVDIARKRRPGPNRAACRLRHAKTRPEVDMADRKHLNVIRADGEFAFDGDARRACALARLRRVGALPGATSMTISSTINGAQGSSSKYSTSRGAVWRSRWGMVSDGTVVSRLRSSTLAVGTIITNSVGEPRNSDNMVMTGVLLPRVWTTVEARLKSLLSARAP